MAKRSNQKLKLLYLSKILIENTDEQNAITMSQILRELEKYGVLAERKSIYDDIEALRIFGIDVQTTRDRYIRYYVSKNDFDLAELKLIFDLVSRSGLLTESKSRELLKKLNAPTQSDLFALDNDSSSTANEDVYKNLSLICKAIYSDKKIRFKCFEWNTRKQRVVQFDGEYFVLSPVKLILNDGAYEAICFNEASDAFETYRTDRMRDLSVVNVKRKISSADEPIAANAERIRLRCKNSIASEVFEYFGLDVTVLSEREEYFEISVKVNVSDEFFSWVFTKAGSVRISEPEWVKERYRDMLQNNLCEDEKK